VAALAATIDAILHIRRIEFSSQTMIIQYLRRKWHHRGNRASQDHLPKGPAAV
jgi:hypothetical protein